MSHFVDFFQTRLPSDALNAMQLPLSVETSLYLQMCPISLVSNRSKSSELTPIMRSGNFEIINNTYMLLTRVDNF